MSHPPLNHPIGQPFIVLPKVDSSNNYAMAQAHAALAFHGATYFALEQTSGKGQRGKSWVANAGENIMLSIVLQPDTAFVGKPFLLSAIIALTCYDFFKNHAGPETTIKWPNDVYWRDRKAGGLLIENVFRGTDWPYAIAGIGININQGEFDPSLKNPVSLRQITGRSWDVIALAKELCQSMESRYQESLHSTPAAIFEEYRQALYKLDKPVKLKKEHAIFETTIRGVSPEGRLLTRDTMEREFNFGEVEWII